MDENSINFKFSSVQDFQLYSTPNCPDAYRKWSNVREAGLHLHHAKKAFALVWDPLSETAKLPP